MLAALVLLLLTFALLLWPVAVTGGIASSLSYCLSALVPSLFPFMVLCGFAVESSAALWLSRPLGFCARYLFRLPDCCAAPVLMGLIGGYPAGARGTSLLLEKGRITEKEARRMLMFCVNPGLAFTVTYLGIGVFGNPALGLRLFLSVTLSAVVLGVLSGLFSPLPSPDKPGAERIESRPGALTRSVEGAARSVLLMCAFLLLFSGLSTLLHEAGIFQGAVRLLSRLGVFTPNQWAAILSFLLEVTGGTGDARALGIGPGFFAFGLAFGGVCVHLQVLAMFRKPPIRPPLFLLCRLAHGLLSAGAFALMGVISPMENASTAPVMAGIYRPELSGGWRGGASLALMCAAFLLMVPGETGKSSLRAPGPKQISVAGVKFPLQNR